MIIIIYLINYSVTDDWWKVWHIYGWPGWLDEFTFLIMLMQENFKRHWESDYKNLIQLDCSMEQVWIMQNFK